MRKLAWDGNRTPGMIAERRRVFQRSIAWGLLCAAAALFGFSVI